MPGPIKTEKPKNVKATLKKLLSSIKKFYLPIIIGLVCAMIGTILTIIGPDKIKEIGTIIQTSEMTGKEIDLPTVNKIAITLLIIYLSSFLFNFTQNFILTKVCIR